VRPEDSTQAGMLKTSGNKIAILIISSVTGFIAAIMTSALNVALPAINLDFNADAVLLSWVVTSYILAMAVFSVPFGRIADIIGIKKIYTMGIILFTISTGAIAFSNSIVMLIACRTIQGASSAMLASTSVAMIMAVLPPKDRGFGIGTSIALVYTGFSIGPFFGGVLTEHLGWRSIFLISVALSLIMIIILFWKVQGEWAECKGEKFDYLGSALYGIALVALMYGFSVLPGVIGAILTIIGIAGILLFFYLERRMKSPILAVNVFSRNRLFIFANLASMISYIGTAGIVFLVSLYLQYIKGLSPQQAGLVLVAQPVVQAILSPITGKLSDKPGFRILSAIGMSMIFIGLLIFSLINESTLVILIVIILILIGVGVGLFTTPNTNAVMSSITSKYYGVTSSMIATVRTMGQTLSMGIATIVIAIILGRVVITPEYYPAFMKSFKIIFAILAVFCFIGIFASLVRGKPDKVEEKA
jgi:EmrB/QacA subfamily drug resistance transporter